jgi:Zn-finger nucleic acid-binding protein
MNRRDVLRGLICAPLVITTPGLLMPVKAIPKEIEYAMNVRGVWLDGTEFDIGIEYGYSVADLTGMDWFDTVARVDAVIYNDDRMQQMVVNQSAIFDPHCRYDSQAGKPMLPWFERKANRYVHNNGICTFAELRQQGFKRQLSTDVGKGFFLAI